MSRVPTVQQLVDWLDGNETDIANYFGCDLGDLDAPLAVMAAAPDLLAVCKIMRDRLTELANEKDYCWNDWPDSYAVDAAIAKAEGSE